MYVKAPTGHNMTKKSVANVDVQTVETEWVFETADKGRILVRMEGSTSYQNNALHGFGRA